MKYLSVCFMLFIASCSSTDDKSTREYVPVNLPKEQPPVQAGFYCPMKCEGDKVYETDAKKCPVCDMKLVPTKK